LVRISLWNKVLTEHIFKLVDEVLEIYMMATRSETQPTYTPKFSIGKADIKESLNKAA